MKLDQPVLQEHQHHIGSKDCQNSVFYYITPKDKKDVGVAAVMIG